ncbi:MAG: DRTGG domain-containing protein [Eubacteriales bacterium]
MKISKIVQVLSAQCLTCADSLETEVHSACGSDMMSDVLAFVKDQAVLLTGLINTQVIRTCQMMDIHCVVFVRGKKPGPDVLKLAEESGIVVLITDLRMYDSCGRLYASGLIGGRTHE